MERNQNTPKETKYKRTAPPLTREEANARLDEIELAKAQIETDLKHKDLDDFPIDDEFYTWRSRAISALGHINAEINFIEKWLSLQPKAK